MKSVLLRSPESGRNEQVMNEVKFTGTLTEFFTPSLDDPMALLKYQAAERSILR